MLHLYTLIVLAAMAPIVSVRSIICNGLLSHPLRPAELGSSGACNRVTMVFHCASCQGEAFLFDTDAMRRHKGRSTKPVRSSAPTS